MAHQEGPAPGTGKLFGPEMRADPYPIYHHLRATDPVHWDDDINGWVLTRYDDVAAALHDLRLSSDRAAYLREVAHQEELRPFFDFLSNRMVLADPPK
jgi:cytochrome P450